MDVTRLSLHGPVKDQVDIADNGGGISLRCGRRCIELFFLIIEQRDVSAVELLEDLLH